MKKVLRLFGWILLAGMALGAFAISYSTSKGHLMWFFRVAGSVSVNGHYASGYMHANSLRTFLLVTTTDGRKPETYVVPLISIRMWDCGNWHPIRFLPTAIGDLHSSCMLPAEALTIIDPPLPGTLVRGEKSVEFTTASGRRVRAEW